MLDNNQLLKVIQDVFNNLYDGNYLDTKITVNESTNLIGGDSILDSMGFVTFFSELEEQLCEETSQDIYLVLEDIIDFDIDMPELTVGVMINYIKKTINEL